MYKSNSAAAFLRLSTEIVFASCPVFLHKEESSERFHLLILIAISQSIYQIPLFH